MTIVNDKSLLLRQTNDRRKEIQVDPDKPDLTMEVWIRDISFLDIQRAAQEMFNIAKDGSMTLNLEGYWRFAFSNWVTLTNPSLTTDELMNLTGYVGEQISTLMPSPDELGQMMQGGFTKGNSSE